MSRDDTYLLDMLIAAKHATEFASTVSEEEFRHSRLHQDAIVYELQTIGEAAAHVSVEGRAEHTTVEWSKIIPMRHRLVHDYRNIDLDIVWAVVNHEVADLIEYLERVVPPDDSEL